MKYVKTVVLGLSLSLLANSAVALEPFKDRARTVSMTADLLLPDESLMTVDLDLDCGSDFHNTAMLITTEQGAHLLAAAYTHLWGKEAGQHVMDKWNNRKNTDDPRLPSYLVITPPEEAKFDWKKPQKRVANIKRKVESSRVGNEIQYNQQTKMS